MMFKSSRVWGSNSRGYISLDDAVGGGSPPNTPDPMKLEDNPVIRGNAQDPPAKRSSIELKAIIGEGISTITLQPRTPVSQEGRVIPITI